MNSSLLCADIPHHTLKLFAQEAFWVKLSINAERTRTASKGLEGNKVSKTEIFEASVLREDAVFVTPKKQTEKIWSILPIKDSMMGIMIADVFHH